jgi:hypothetical protein
VNASVACPDVDAAETGTQVLFIAERAKWSSCQAPQGTVVEQSPCGGWRVTHASVEQSSCQGTVYFRVIHGCQRKIDWVEGWRAAGRARATPEEEDGWAATGTCSVLGGGVAHRLIELGRRGVLTAPYASPSTDTHEALIGVCRIWTPAAARFPWMSTEHGRGNEAAATRPCKPGKDARQCPTMTSSPQGGRRVKTATPK